MYINGNVLVPTQEDYARADIYSAKTVTLGKRFSYGLASLEISLKNWKQKYRDGGNAQRYIQRNVKE